MTSKQKQQEGPAVRLSTSCFGCKYEESIRDECQGDVSWDNYCTHPSFDKRKYMGGNGDGTPDFCPYKKEAVSRLVTEKIRLDKSKMSKCKECETDMVTMAAHVRFDPDKEPYHSGEVKNLDLELEEWVYCEYCETCKKIKSIWVDPN